MKNLISKDDYEAALTRGRTEMSKPHAVEACLLAQGTTLQVKFSNGLKLQIEVCDIPAFKGIPLSSFKKPHVTAGGDGLIFEEANLAFNLTRLLAPFVPIDLARSRVATESGKTSSVKKAQAARVNGTKGGRPRKVDVAAVAGVAAS